MFCRLTFFYTSNSLWCTFCYHQPMVVIPTEKAFASRSYTVVSAAPVTHNEPLSTKATAYSWQEMLNTSLLPLWSHGTFRFHNPQPTGFNHGGEESILLSLACNNSSNQQAQVNFACSRYHYAWKMCSWQSVMPAKHNEYARLPVVLHCINKSYPASMCRCFKPMTSQSHCILTCSTAAVYCWIVNNY